MKDEIKTKEKEARLISCFSSPFLCLFFPFAHHIKTYTFTICTYHCLLVFYFIFAIFFFVFPLFSKIISLFKNPYFFFKIISASMYAPNYHFYPAPPPSVPLLFLLSECLYNKIIIQILVSILL
eukprot:UN10958